MDNCTCLDSDPLNCTCLDSDPLVEDMKTVTRMFPGRDLNEIYAYLEAHTDKRNRVQIVTDELLGSTINLNQVDEDAQ